jgi:hypothetical protein
MKMSESRQRIPEEPMEEDLEAEAEWVQCNLTVVLDRHAPPRPVRARSKRWWTDKLKQERKKFNIAKRALRENPQSQLEYRRIRNS